MSEPKSINKKPCEGRRPFIGRKSHGFAGGERYVIQKINQNLHLLMIASIIWNIYQGKLIQDIKMDINGTFQSTSGQRLVDNVSLHAMQRRHAQQCKLWRLVHSNDAQRSLHSARINIVHLADATQAVCCRCCLNIGVCGYQKHHLGGTLSVH